MVIMLQSDLDNIINILDLAVPKSILRNELKLFVSGSSKRIRSVLALLYFKALDFKISAEIYKLLAVGELVHNASLLHDDVIDDADTRRGVCSLNKTYSSKVSVLAGDYLLGIVENMLLQLDNKLIISLFANCLKTMCRAEINQYFLRGKMPSEFDYLKICAGKTGKLFSVILESGAILLQTDRLFAKKFGMIYGLMFQIKNDMEIVSAQKDKNNGIYTAIDIMGIEKTNYLLDNYKEKMLGMIGNIPQNKYKIRLEDLIKEL